MGTGEVGAFLPTVASPAEVELPLGPDPALIQSLSFMDSPAMERTLISRLATMSPAQVFLNVSCQVWYHLYSLSTVPCTKNQLVSAN